MRTPTEDESVRTAETDLRIGGMTCGSCSSRIERHLNKVDGVTASVNLATETAHVSYDPAAVQPDELIAIVERAGYHAEHAPEHETAHDHAEHGAGARLMAALALSVPVVVMSMAPSLQFSYWQWVAGALATPVVWWCGWGFHVRAFRALLIAEAGMDTLISLGALAAWCYSLVAVLFLGAGGAHEHMQMSLGSSSSSADIYFEVAAGVVTLILLGRWLEGRARRRAGDAVRSLLTLQSRDARVVQGGVERWVSISDVRVGDHVVVRAGERVPVDGVVLEGRSALDTSLVTGESVPRSIEPGSEVIGATINVSGQLVIEATRIGADTMLAQIAEQVRHAQAGKAQIQRLADRVSAVFVPLVMLAALATLGWWIGNGASSGFAFGTAVAVLIVACPCAMGLATPVALMAGTGRGAQLGILIGGAEVLESTRRIDTVVFDKTGTLTHGQMQLVDTIAVGDTDGMLSLRRAAAIERASNHPIAQAIAAAVDADSLPSISDVTEHAGEGITATIADASCFVGSLRLVTTLGGVIPQDVADRAAAAAAAGTTVVATGTSGAITALLVLADEPRSASAATIEQLRAMGLRVVMLTGDRRATAVAIAAPLGIAPSDVIADVMPTDKADEIERLQQAGATVAMVGDGINDAPALARANLGVSMGSGSDVAIQASDITLVGSDIAKVADAIRLARRTLRTIQGNLFWAFAYNTLAIPLAATGHLNPLIAAAAMAFSSLFVVLNSLRLRAFQLKGHSPA